MLQLYTYVIYITSKPLFFVHFVDDVDLNVTFQVFLFSLVGLKCCGFLFFFWFASCQVRKQNCKIKNSLNHFLSHLFLSLLANIFACNPLSSRKTTLYSEVEVVLVRSFLTQTLSHWVTLSFLYSFFCKCRFSLSARLWAYSQSGKQKKITNWMKRWNTRCSSHTATQSAHLHLAQDAERSEKQPADTPHKHFGGREVGIRGNTPSCRELEVSHCRQQSKLQHHLRAQTNYWRKTASGKGQRTQTWEEGEKLCLSATSCTISPNVIDVGHMCDLQRKSTYKNIYGSYFLLPCWNFQI